MNKEKIFFFEKKAKGSILAFSLIILSMMLVIATSFSITTIIDKKSASGTEFSVQSLQTADSGVQTVLKTLNTGSHRDVDSISSVFTDCPTAGNSITSVSGDNGPVDSNYKVTFFKDDGITQLYCSDKIGEIGVVKVLGTYKNTVRSVSIATSNCPPTIKDADGNSYNTIKIGEQCWMAKNLRVKTTGNSEGNRFGALYDWADIFFVPNPIPGVFSSDARRYCPIGWHISSQADWATLYQSLGMSPVEASKSGWHGTNQGTQLSSRDGFDAFQSTASPTYVYFWTDHISFDGGWKAGYVELQQANPKIFDGSGDISSKYSVRCVQN